MDRYPKESDDSRPVEARFDDKNSDARLLADMIVTTADLAAELDLRTPVATEFFAAVNDPRIIERINNTLRFYLDDEILDIRVNASFHGDIECPFDQSSMIWLESDNDTYSIARSLTSTNSPDYTLTKLSPTTEIPNCEMTVEASTVSDLMAAFLVPYADPSTVDYRDINNEVFVTDLTSIMSQQVARETLGVSIDSVSTHKVDGCTIVLTQRNGKTTEAVVEKPLIDGESLEWRVAFEINNPNPEPIIDIRIGKPGYASSEPIPATRRQEITSLIEICQELTRLCQTEKNQAIDNQLVSFEKIDSYESPTSQE